MAIGKLGSAVKHGVESGGRQADQAIRLVTESMAEHLAVCTQPLQARLVSGNSGADWPSAVRAPLQNRLAVIADVNEQAKAAPEAAPTTPEDPKRERFPREPGKRRMGPKGVKIVLAAAACLMALGWVVVVATEAEIGVRTAPQSIATTAPAVIDNDGWIDALSRSDAIAAAAVAESATAMSPTTAAPEASVANDISASTSANDGQMPAVTQAQPTAPQSTAGRAILPAIVADPGVRLRERPSIDGRILDTLAPGATVMVTGGAAAGDGYQWVPVETAGSLAGWVVADGLQ